MSSSNIFCGFGKLVLSGDTIVIRERARDGPPSSCTVVLSNIVAPKVAKRPANPSTEATLDEPFGWIAREFVRSKVVGREICYIVENEVSPDRVYGCVFLGKGPDAENLAHLLVSEGLAKVRRNMSQAMIDKNPPMQTLIALEEKAKANNKGIWSNSDIGAPRNICWNIPDMAGFLRIHGRKPLRGIVEFVRDGNMLQILLFPDAKDAASTYYAIMILISGIKTPSSSIVDGSRVYEPFSLDAQFYVESRLLQREVTVFLESISNNSFVGSILHPSGNIAVYLLREGLAKCLEWNLAALTKESGGADAYREAEQVAKQRRLRIWKDYAPPACEEKHTAKAKSGPNDQPALGSVHTGTVIEVGNGDNITVRCTDGEVRKFFLSSIRPPRLPQDKEGKPQQQAVSRPLYQVPYLYEAREFLRKRLIGKEVKVFVDYVQPKPAESTLDDRVCATVLIGECNIAEALVSRGLASVVRYRNATDLRSRAYDLLLSAESSAQNKPIGIHDSKEPPVHRFSELGGNVAKSRQFLYSLQRAGLVDALIEFVSSASRLRLVIHREDLLCTVIVSGVICPRPSRKLPNQPKDPGDPFGDFARDYTHELVMQREVKFEVDGMDRVGNLIGWITLPSEVKVSATGQKRGKKGPPSFSSNNLSVLLVARGYATVNRASSIQRSSHYATLIKAEAFAEKHSLGLWSSEEFRASWNAEMNVDEGDDKENPNDSDQKDGLLSVKDLQKALPDPQTVEKMSADRLKLSNIAQVTAFTNPTSGVNGLRFFVQLKNRINFLDSMNQELNKPNFLAAESSTNFQPKRGLICAARFSGDNRWYRARVLHISGKVVTVLFIDFGSVEIVDTSLDGAMRLAALPKNLANQEPLATEYRLAYVQLPPDRDDREMVLDFLSQSIIEQDIRVSPVQGPPTPCGKDDNRPVQGAVIYVKSAQALEASSSTQNQPEYLDLAEQLLSDGRIYMENSRMPLDICVRYSEAQNSAMRGRKNIWRYGDFRDDDDA